MKHRVENHADGPNIAFLIEYAFSHAFWTLVTIEGHFSSDFWLVELSAVAEPSDFQDVVFEEERGWFESPMDEFFLGEMSVPHEKISKKGKSFTFLERSSGGDAVIDISAFAKLSDDVAIVEGGVDI